MAQLVLGFDFGRRRIGVALAERLSGTSCALKSVHVRGSELPWEEIDKLVTEWRPAQLVVGLPYRLDGTEGSLAGEVRAFASELGRRTGRPVALCNEALSTEAARAELRGARRGSSRGQDRDRLNAEAARMILTNWLGHHAR